jgi:hypothetical protein
VDDEALSWRQSGRFVKLTTHFHIVLKSNVVQLYLHSPYVSMA